MYTVATKIITEMKKKTEELFNDGYKDAICYFKQILEATSHKTAGVHPLVAILQIIQER